jgi:LytS/YehU family sensor histidine kinase
LLGSENGSSTITTHFIIKPPFWLSWWFLSGCVLLAIGIVWYFILHREKAIRQKETEKNKIRKQITELEIKALKSQMNPHFVFNSLNSIAHLIASNQNQRGIEYLAKFSKLLRMILDEAENNFVLLKDEIKMLNLYLQIEALRFGETFGHTIYADDDIDEEEISVPALLVHPLAENAVWHGLLHKQGERRMIIHFKKISDNMLQCIVKDNGIGIEAAKAMKEARLNGSIQKSKGMQLVKERLKMLEEQYNSPTFFSIADAHEEHALISGTVVTIQFPVLYAS